MNIFFCDDQRQFIKQYKQLAENYLRDNFKNIKSNVFEVESGNELLILARESETVGGIYFLDIDLGPDQINGIQLAVEIRNLDPYAEIAFISTHDEMMKETIKQKVNTLNFIYKEDGEEVVTREIKETIHAAIMHNESKMENYTPKVFTVKFNGILRQIPEDDIYYFEKLNNSARNKLILHTKNELIEFRGTMKEVQAELPDFIQCHQSFLINKNNVKQIDYRRKKIIFSNDITCDFAVRKLGELRRLFG